MRREYFSNFEYRLERQCRCLSERGRIVLGVVAVIAATSFVEIFAKEMDATIGVGAVYFLTVVGVSRFLGRAAGVVASVLAVASYQFIFRPTILGFSPWHVESGIALGHLCLIAVAFLASRPPRGPNSLSASGTDYEDEVKQGEIDGRNLVAEIRFNRRPYLLGVIVEKMVEDCIFGPHEIGLFGVLGDSVIAAPSGNNQPYQANTKAGVVEASGKICSGPI